MQRRHRILTWSDATTTLTPEEWLKKAPLHAGSWWPAWEHWLAAHSAARQVPARTVTAAAGNGGGGVLEDAPGQYVRG